MRNNICCAVCGARDEQVLTMARGNRGLSYIAAEHPVVMCRRCGLVYLNPQHAQEDYDRYYKFSDYGPIVSSAKALLRKHDYRRIQAAFILDTAQRLKGRERRGLVLDVGCGPGILMYFLERQGFEVRGLDSSVEAATYAQRTFGLNVSFGSVLGDSIEASAYDIISSTASIEHFTDPFEAILAMKRGLKPGGLLYVNTPDLKGLVLKKGEPNWFKFVHTYYFTEISLSNLLEKAGLRVVRSWTAPPILKANWVYPGNYCGGELNIVAANDGSPAMSSPRRRESVGQIVRSFDEARRRDRWHAAARYLGKFRAFSLIQRVASKLIAPQPLFGELADPDQDVDVAAFPPLLAN